MQDYIRTSTYQRAMLDNTADFHDKVVYTHTYTHPDPSTRSYTHIQTIYICTLALLCTNKPCFTTQLTFMTRSLTHILTHPPTNEPCWIMQPTSTTRSLTDVACCRPHCWKTLKKDSFSLDLESTRKQNGALIVLEFDVKRYISSSTALPVTRTTADFIRRRSLEGLNCQVLQ